MRSEATFSILPFRSLMKLLPGVSTSPACGGPSTYSIVSRLHVNIFDTSAQQFTLPLEYFELHVPKPGEQTSPELQFNYQVSPFAFWITRRSDPDSAPIFDTRLTSLPAAPIPAFLRAGHDPSLAFDGFPLVFEDRYLQVFVQLIGCSRNSLYYSSLRRFL
jgi:N-terminal barrel of NtMGAM and CtMGAM, maltase-glucoamylase